MPYLKPLLWAAALVLLAMGNRFGLVADDVADTLFIVLPLLAVLSLRGGLCCLPRRRGRPA